MHLCFISFDYPTETTRGGGVGTYVQIISKELVKKQHNVSVVALRVDASPLEYNDEGVNIYRFAPGNIHYYISKIPIVGKIMSLPLRELEYSWNAYNVLKKIAKKKPVDISEGIETGNFFIAISSLGKKHIIRLHGDTYTFSKYTKGQRITAGIRLSRLIQRFALRRSTYLIAPSKSHAEEINMELGGNAEIKIIPNPVEFPTGFIREKKIDSRNKYFLFVGRLQKVKGIMDLLEAILLVKKLIPSILFKIAGNCHPSLNQSDLISYIERLNIQENVKFTGFVPKEDLKILYKNASGVVIPSFYETFGYICIEALSMGTPVVSYDVGIASDIIFEGQNGFLVPIGDKKKLAEACIKVLGLKYPMRSNTHFEWLKPGNVSNSLLQVYESLIN